MGHPDRGGTSGWQWHIQTPVGCLDPDGTSDPNDISYQGRQGLSKLQARGMSSVAWGDGISVAVERQPEEAVGDDAAVAQGAASPGYHSPVPSL